MDPEKDKSKKKIFVYSNSAKKKNFFSVRKITTIRQTLTLNPKKTDSIDLLIDEEVCWYSSISSCIVASLQRDIKLEKIFKIATLKSNLTYFAIFRSIFKLLSTYSGNLLNQILWTRVSLQAAFFLSKSHVLLFFFEFWKFADGELLKKTFHFKKKLLHKF